MRLCSGLLIALSIAEGASAFSLVHQPVLFRSPAAALRRSPQKLFRIAEQNAGTSGRVGLRRSGGLIAARAQEIGIMEGSGPLRKVANFGILAAFMAWVTFLGPDVDPEGTKTFFADTLKFFQGQESPANPILVAIWTAFPLWPAALAGLICPLKPKNQALPDTPFVAASFIIGTAAIAPYLALNSYAEGETDSDSTLAKTFGGKPAAIVMLVSALAFLAFGVGVFAPNDINGGSDYPIDVIFFTYLKGFWSLLQTQKVASAPTLDCVFLWLLSAKPLLEDMKRRKWFSGDAADWALILGVDFVLRSTEGAVTSFIAAFLVGMALFSSFMAAPLVGMCFWLCVRPELPAISPPAPEPEA
ncbi:hypothetical protein T484DRAFT_1877447 [Baffinella frigidus]|nr:hypothetical protein T484DRAFT_1877447 [Cryptophyta sp. CCMP2293]